ncbi:hypothetical protein [Streptomyces griseoruber]|uniref:hypothetical protein n=1 Tax=Streptomyces griseoruber TaxID=1943 RepID=UPI003798A5CB
MDTVGWWSLVRFAYVAGAALWVGGQLAVSLVVLPLARHLLAPRAEDRFTAAAGRRFGLLTGAVFPPVRPATGWAMAWHGASPGPRSPNPVTAVRSRPNPPCSSW